jgi:regulatory protein
LNQSNPQPAPDAGTAEAYQKTYASAVRLLARREHSVLELRQKLVVRKFDGGIIDRVLAELIDLGYLSDKRFAELYVRGRFERGIGPLRIRAELRERGIPDGLMADPLEELSARWVESALQQREKRFGEMPPADFEVRAKQMRFLQRRGFSGEQIRAVFQD